MIETEYKSNDGIKNLTLPILDCNNYPMRNLFTSLLFAGFVLAATPAFAGTNQETLPEVSEGKRQQIEQMMLEKQRLILQKQEQKLQRQNQAATRSAKLAESKKVNIRRLYENMYKKYFAMIKRLEKLASRIEAKMAAIEEEENINLAGSKAELAKARALLDTADASLTAADNTFEQTLDSTDPKSSFAVIGESLIDTKKNLVEVHGILVKIIGEIKGIRVGAKPTLNLSPEN